MERDIKKLRQDVNLLTRDLKGELMLAKFAKVKRYEQFRQNKIFYLDRNKIYAKLNGNAIRSNEVPSAEECTMFWSDIWEVRKENNREAD